MRHAMIRHSKQLIYNLLSYGNFLINFGFMFFVTFPAEYEASRI